MENYRKLSFNYHQIPSLSVPLLPTMSISKLLAENVKNCHKKTHKRHLDIMHIILPLPHPCKTFFYLVSHTEICWICKNIRFFYGCEVWIDSSVTRVTVRQYDAELCRTVIPSDGIFNSHRTAIMDSFSCILFLQQLHLKFYMHYNIHTT